MLENGTAPSFRLRLPPAHWFTLTPDQRPLTVPASTDTRDFAAPFGVNETFYHAALDWKVPVTIASVYAVTVIFINALNRSNGNKPWYISKTFAFKAFVIVHNVALAIFSALTCFGMLRTLAHTWPGATETQLFGKFWPSFLPENGLAGAADALCHMHGPRGFGDAVYYDTASQAWKSKNTLINLLESRPDPTDVGRIWNEGLAFWGFWFYISKFYEVIDTLIIVAKGKRSSTLQTYHHAGAMMSMWAGIRYMGPPIWMFVFINSGIHAVMYTYYTLTALKIKVPKAIKQLITTMQISQFLIGITFASLHLFVEYTVPVTSAYTITHTVTSMIQEATASASSMVSEASASIVSSIGVAQILKKIALRAAGEEGLAENIRNKQGQQFQAHEPVLPKIVPKFREHMNSETKYRTVYETMDCVETQGEVFAIMLNIIYLLPLTFLFARFFVRSYLRRSKTQDGPQRRWSDSIHEAADDVRREFESAGRKVEDPIEAEINESKQQSKQESGADQTDTPSKKKRKNKNKNHANSAESSTSSLKESADDLLKQGKDQVQKAKDAVLGDNESSSASSKDTKTSHEPHSYAEAVKEGVQETVKEGKSLVDDIKDKAEDAAAEAKKQAPSTESKIKQEKADDKTVGQESGSPSKKPVKDKLDESAVIVEATKIEPLVPEGQAPAGGVKENTASPSKGNNNGKNSTPSKKRR